MDNQGLKKNAQIKDQTAENITRTEELAYEIKICEVMTKQVLVITEGQQMSEVVDIFRQRRISGAPVTSKAGRLIGIVSMEDLIQCLCQSDLKAPVEKYMSRKIQSIKSEDPVIEALKVFVSSRVGRLPVLDEGGNLIGIITKGDVTRGVLRALQKDYQEEEVRRYRASHLFEDIESDRSSLILRYAIKQGDFNHGGSASSNIKRALVRLGASPLTARKCGIAVYEAEMNLIIHTNNGGMIRVEIDPHRISIDAYDDGPGIKDVDQALKPGYSTATDEIRKLGFGAGMGLVNIARCVDNMVLESAPEKGTRLRMRIYMQNEETVGEGYNLRKEIKPE